MGRQAACGRRSHAVLLVASAGCSLTVLDTNVVGIVLPTIARDLQASFAQVEWVVSAYVLCFAALLLPAGTLADRYGRRRIFLCGIGVFALASLACGMAPSAMALYLARAGQGCGAALLLAPALALIGHAFHGGAQRDRAWASWGAIMGLAMVVSPLLGAAIGAWLGWRWAFYLNLLICPLLAAAVLMVVEESRDPTPRALDIPGMALFASAMLGITWALILVPGHGWGSAAVLLPAVVGMALFVAFAWVERNRAAPMLDLGLFTIAPFVGGVLAMFAYACCAQVMASLLPLFLQNGAGLAVLSAGIAMLPFALAMLVFPQLGRWLSARLGGAAILPLGLAIVALGNFLMMFAASQQTPFAVAAGMLVMGAGGGLLNGETQKAIMGTVPRHRAGMASGISTTARFSGVLFGFAGLGAIVADGARRAVHDGMMAAQLPVEPGFVDGVIAGDLARAIDIYPPALAPAIAAIARDGYRLGFAQAFLVAGCAALAAALLVIALIGRVRRT